MKKGLLVIGLVLLSINAQAQENEQKKFTVSGQYFTRTEFRNGQALLQSEDDKAAFQTGQRMRLEFNYIEENLKLYGSVQDIRIWGSAPQIKANDPFLSVHEAWAEYAVNPFVKLKVGRQELNYDNFRFLGNLDWALQGRAHEIALLKYEKEALKVHVGYAYNVAGESTKSGIYPVTPQYKTAQMIHAEYVANTMKIVGLVWNNGMQDLVAAQSLKDETVYMTTIGLPEISWKKGSFKALTYAYYQFGTDQNQKKVSAFNISAEVSNTFAFEKDRSLIATAGFEILSGTDFDQDQNKNNTFNPLYGTNHRFNGFMDFFYVGGRNNRGAGLIDTYSLMRYYLKKNLFISLNSHAFMSHATLNGIDSFLGVEEDIALGWVVNKSFSIQAGYSQVFAADNLAKVQAVAKQDGLQNWTYVMLIFRPQSAAKFIGLKW
ncbi:MAG: hypothetical protein GW809_05625 [Bacteroidetes bacterium]|nr:hypothetical protein [Bacteroidota bacterium]NCQ11615.1 hypothetical protein [Bacteroidota bacterium]